MLIYFYLSLLKNLRRLHTVFPLSHHSVCAKLYLVVERINVSWLLEDPMVVSKHACCYCTLSSHIDICIGQSQFLQCARFFLKLKISARKIYHRIKYCDLNSVPHVLR